MELTDVVVPIIVGVATAYAGYRFGCWKTRQDLLVGKQVGLVEEFITAAHTNLRYLPGGGAEGQGGPAAADLAVLGTRAGLFVSRSSAEAIEEFTRMYFSCFVKWGGDRAPTYGDVKEKLNELAASLRREIRGED